ncbi:DUF167 family protein [Hyphococcus sp.]|uniref:DUF167 family protein n=1 Tax=Hyphococcus sp. TaxID=2038636 RepID=UPI0026A56DF6
MTDDGARLFVRASPGARKDSIEGVWRGADGEARLAVKVTAPPDKGKANAAILKLLAAALGLAKSALTVTAGETSRLKTIDVKAEKKALSAALKKLGEPGTGKAI